MSDEILIKYFKKEPAPEWFKDLMAEWLIKYGPDRHCDGYEEIADLAWHEARRDLIQSEDETQNDPR